MFTARYFRMIRVVHPLAYVGFAAIIAAAAIVIVLGSSMSSRALAPLFLLQALATSSGFTSPARRGHYDLLFTTGQTRAQIALVHWAMSALPGTVAWLLIGVVELVAWRGTSVPSLASGTAAGMFLVSTLPWAATVSLPRLTGGISWMLVAVLAISVVPEMGRTVTAPASLLHPWMLAGRRLTSDEIVQVAPAMIVALGAMAAALTWIGRQDVPLETAQ